MNGKSQSRNQPNTNLKYSNSYISLSKYVLGRNKKNERSLTSSLSFTINQQERFKNRDNYIFEITDLNGEMFKKKFRDPSPTLGNWDNFLNKSLNQDRSNKTKQISNKKLIENSLTCRTINPHLVKDNNKLKKGKSICNLKYTASGSISNLINSTPLIKVVKKQTNILRCSNIFTPDTSLHKPKKHMVNLDKIKRNASYAGSNHDNINRDFNPEKQPAINYSKNRKIVSLKSNIFDPINEKDKKNSSDIIRQSSINYTVDIIDNTKKKISNKSNKLH